MSYLDDVSPFTMPTYRQNPVSGGTNGLSSFLPQDWSYGSASPSIFPAGMGGGATEPTFRQSLLGYKDANGISNQGWGMPALGAAKGLFDSWMAMKSYGLAKQQLAEGKRQFGLNFDAQMRTTNAALEDRQRARLASNPGAYQSVGDYMSKNGIRGG